MYDWLSGALTVFVSLPQVDSAATNGTGPPPVPEADIKEAWLQSCRTLYEVHPLAPAP